MNTIARRTAMLAVATLLPMVLALAPAEAQTCSQPSSDGSEPVVRDCIQIARASIGAVSCPDCVCDTNGSGSITIADALHCLWFVVGSDVTLDCPACESTTTTEPPCASCAEVFFHTADEEDLCESSRVLYDTMLDCPCTECAETCEAICTLDSATTISRECPRCILESCRDAVAACLEEPAP